MDSRNAEDLPAVSRDQLIAGRLRFASIVLVAALGLNAVVDLAHRPGGLAPVAWVYAGGLALVLLLQPVTRVLRRRVQLVAALAVVAWNALFCSYAALSPAEIHALVGPSIAIVTGAALLLPWGLVPQLAVGCACAATYAGALALSGRPAELGTVYALASLIGATAVSCVGAYLLDEHARLIDRHTESLHAMNRMMREAGTKKDEFLASVSHELRTPLNVVLGYVDLLLDHSFGPLEPAQRDILHRITKNASNLSHLINDLVDLSRIEAGRLKVEIGTVDLAPLFADLVGTMEVLLAGRDVSFTARTATGCERVAADPDRLKQIVSNLLVNAVKFTERGTITLEAAPAANGTVAISVTDTGIGIPATAQGAIFEPFRQVHDRSRRVPGAGIGLSISSRLAHLMGGALVVESEPDRGSRFTLTMPIAATAGESGRTAEALRRVS